MMPGSLRNWRRTSSIIRRAARPTARMASEAKTKTSAAPIRPPTKTRGLARSTTCGLHRDSPPKRCDLLR